MIRSEVQAAILRNGLKYVGPEERKRVNQLLAEYDADEVLKAAVARACRNAGPAPPRKPVESRDPVWPFGKHRGKALSATPADYLRWGAENMKNPFNKLCRDEIERREVSQ